MFNLDYHQISGICFCLALSFLILALMNDISRTNEYNLYPYYKKLMRRHKLSGLMYGIALTSITFSIIALYAFTPKVIISFIGSLIYTTIYQA
jgi:hypothetical protein